MRTILVSFIFSFLILSSANLHAENRNYTALVRDDQGNPILKIICEYIGKKPIGEFKYDIPWKTVDTDFYSITFTNLTEQRIEFISQKIRLKYLGNVTGYKQLPDGRVVKYKRRSTKFIDFLKNPNPDYRPLQPHEKRFRNNWFISMGNEISHNVSYRNYVIRHNGKEYSFKIYIVYKKDT